MAQADFRRDRLTWVAYVMLAGSPTAGGAGDGHVHLRDELERATDGRMHIAAFAREPASRAISTRLERTLGGARCYGAAPDGRGNDGLTAGRARRDDRLGVVMGVGGGLLLWRTGGLADHR